MGPLFDWSRDRVGVQDHRWCDNDIFFFVVWKTLTCSHLEQLPNKFKSRPNDLRYSIWDSLMASLTQAEKDKDHAWPVKSWFVGTRNLGMMALALKNVYNLNLLMAVAGNAPIDFSESIGNSVF